MSVSEHDDEEQFRMLLAEIGGAISSDDYEGAENRTLQLLSDIRRRKNGGDTYDD